MFFNKESLADCYYQPNLITDTSLHEDILEIFFKYREEIYRKLIDLKGIFLIDHIALTIIDPNNILTIFSITPSVEYNLIVQGLWIYDRTFSAIYQAEHPFYSWDKAYAPKYFDKIRYIKEIKHGFTFGCNVSKKIEGFHLIYSFATRSKNNGLSEYYHELKNELLNLGDYSYKKISNIYRMYCDPKLIAPSISSKNIFSRKPHFYLISDNGNS